MNWTLAWNDSIIITLQNLIVSCTGSIRFLYHIACVINVFNVQVVQIVWTTWTTSSSNSVMKSYERIFPVLLIINSYFSICMLFIYIHMALFYIYSTYFIISHYYLLNTHKHTHTGRLVFLNQILDIYQKTQFFNIDLLDVIKFSVYTSKR